MLNILIGIPVLDNTEITRACINRLIKYTEPQQCNLKLTLLIIDNGSREDIAGLMRKDFSNAVVEIYYRRNPINLGVGIAWNQILRFSPKPVPDASFYYDYYVILNNDALCGNNWLQPMVKAMESDSRIGWLSCMENGTRLYSDLVEAHAMTKKFRIISDSPCTTEVIEENVKKIYQKWGGQEAFCKHVIEEAGLPPFVPFKGDMHSALCFMLRPEMIQQMGFFEEDSPPIGVAEDLEYFLRIDRIITPEWLTEEQYPPGRKWKKGFCSKSIIHHNFWSCTHQGVNFDSRKWVKMREKNWKAKFGKSKKYYTKLLP